jgi:protein arginine N-methyltransferase 1
MYEYGDVMGLSQTIARANKIKNCHFFHGHSTDDSDPPVVDVIVSETLGNYGLEENIIATVEDAKRFLKPGGTIIPYSIAHFVTPVVSDRFYKDLALWNEVGYGLDFSAAKLMSLNNIYVRTFAPEDLLAGGRAAQQWDLVDFSRKNSSSRQGKATWTLAQPATIYGFAVWWQCGLVPGIDLSTSPLAPKTHWEQLYFPVLEPLSANAGDDIDIAISSESSYESGTTIRWEIDFKPKTGKRQRQTMDLGDGFLA